jgi:hypothetical protein
MPFQFDKEKTRKNIAGILEKIKSESDPGVLNEYRSLFRQEVSLFHRSYTAAYLLMLYDQGNLGPKRRGFNEPANGQYSDKRHNQSDKWQDRSVSRPERQKHNGLEEDHGDQNRYPLAEEESKFLFISVGRNRRVFPRELLGLINTKTAITREDIGAIRILDNYSFVQVRDTAADTIIEALNGKPFRGRTLTVNYARSRKEELPHEGGFEDREPDLSESGEKPDNEAYSDGAVETAGYSDGVNNDSDAYAEADYDGGEESSNIDDEYSASEQEDDHSDKEDI